MKTLYIIVFTGCRQHQEPNGLRYKSANSKRASNLFCQPTLALKLPPLVPIRGAKSHARWFNDGIDCEILKLGSKNWQKGKVRIKVNVEFYVEDPEDSETLEIDEPTTAEPASPLDDLRQMMKEES